MKREIDIISAEVQDPNTPATKAKDTFASKWLNRAFRLCIAWNLITVITVLSQLTLFIIKKSPDYIIPGQGYIYGGATLINAALVGGDMIVDKITERLYPKGVQVSQTQSVSEGDNIGTGK
jgi:hypothetical protein